MANVDAVQPGDYTFKMSAKQLRLKALEFLASRKYTNNLLDIINQWDDSTTLCILTLETVFIEMLRRGDMFLERTIEQTINEPSAEVSYIKWLRDFYDEVWKKILFAIESDKPAIQVQALTTAMKLLAEEGKYPIEPTGAFSYYFPSERLNLIIMKLLSGDKDQTHLMSRFEEIASYKDALFFIWKETYKLIPKGKTKPKDHYIKNLLELIHRLSLPKDNEGDQPAENQELLCGPQQSCGGFTFNYAAARRSLNKIWACIMQWDLNPQLHKQLLIVLLERVMPHLERPVLLTDFLMDSMDVDGPIGLLALQGVFVLVTKHNLEYPAIFTKLYSMFEPEIFHTKYKARLFYLADVFLSSTHLPEALVAAYAKRLARLTLVAPPEDILIILLFIGNLLLRHPGLKRLIDHPQGGEVTAVNPGVSDPFLMEERDPLQSNALHSSLWEIRTLQYHVLPNVATAARFIRDPLPSVEYDMAQALERTGDQIFDKEIKNKVKDIMLTFERPTSMALPRGERILQFWQLNAMR